MAQNITLLGASYSDVPSVLLPKTGGGTARFDDTTDANATASDIASGKTAYVNGTKLTGTASGGGGGSSNYATGEFTLSSNLSLTTSPQKIPNFQLPFVPDYLFIIMNRSSFTSKDSFSAGLYGLYAWKKSIFPPVASSSSNVPETTSSDYVYFVHTNLTSASSITCGYGLSNPSALGTSYYSRFSVNSDGTVSVGRYSSASTKMFAGTYRYFACKV